MNQKENEQREQPMKKVTLHRFNVEPGNILREVFYTKQPVQVTDYRKPIAEIHPPQNGKKPA